MKNYEETNTYEAPVSLIVDNKIHINNPMSGGVLPAIMLSL
jgi:hypothetical protein